MTASPTSTFQQRDLDYYNLPLHNDVTPLYPERTAIKFLKSAPAIDFGARCYLHRAPATSRKRGKGISVDLNSLDTNRIRHIRLVINMVLEEVRLSGKALITIQKYWGYYLSFIDWCDDTGIYSALDDEATLRSALKAYIGQLRERTSYRSKPLHVNTAAMYQNSVIEALTNLYEIDGLATGINLLVRDKRLVNHIEVPDEAAVARVLTWCECLLTGFTDLLVNRKPYPFALPVPTFLTVPDNRLWIFPAKRWAALPGQRGSNLHFDYANGQIRTPEEVYALDPSLPKTVRMRNKELLRTMDISNADHWHNSRIMRGILAMKAYFLLLIATTGQNPSVVANLPWSEDLESQIIGKQATRQQFRAIKYRARGEEITFEVGLKHVDLLRRYLELRKHLLHGRRCDRLFFNFGRDNTLRVPEALDSTCSLSTFYPTLRMLDPDLPSVMPRELRVAKADFLIRITDAATAAIVMQQSPETADRHYREGSHVTHVLEMSGLWKRIAKAVGESHESDAAIGIQPRAGGGCTSPQQPVPIIANPPATPDCKHPEGCFFCNRYHAHADEQDAHKLLSARFCLCYRAELHTGTQEHYERNYRPVLEVIDGLLNRIRELKPDAVTAAELRVAEGELTPYWENKMRVLVELEGLR